MTKELNMQNHQKRLLQTTELQDCGIQLQVMEVTCSLHEYVSDIAVDG